MVHLRRARAARAWSAGLLLVTAATGCPAPLSRMQRAQDAAQQLNEHARFGRFQVAIDHVASDQREEFSRRHAAWGNRVRIADSEMAGMRMTSETEAEVLVRIGWYRPDEQELRVTSVRQTWKDDRGSWRLTNEERAEGDPGLLGDAPSAARGGPSAGAAPADEDRGAASGRAPAAARKNAQFPTVHIGAPASAP